MTAARLRTAAAALREVAEGATSGDWCDYNGLRGHITTLAGTEVAVAGPWDAAYIATLHPPVALAVAAWLDREADEHERYVEGAVRVKSIRTAYANERAQHALAVADAVLGDREMAAP